MKPRWTRQLSVPILLLPLLAARAGSAEELPPGNVSQVDFLRDVQPLLAKHCYDCHGSNTQEAGLRLDLRDKALEGGDSGPSIVPSKPEESLLVDRITAEDEDSRMPPSWAESPALDPQTIDLVRRWIVQGAIWPAPETGQQRAASAHWAYQPLRSSEPPAVEGAAWVRNPIDNFVLARLEAAGIEPSAEADRYTLIKRLHYDLVGLPPEPEEADQFAQDTSPDAYEELVDQLLASPHFGERWGRHWLDKARYADSDGYEKDNPRPDAWHWRDWVIDAVNRDMPFDKFTIQQLAGDLLPDAGPTERLATAFHRQTLTNTEGGVDQEEFRVAAVKDRVETTGAVWLGLTVGCAQCHSHKYDQITQREYYQFFAFFNNGDEVTHEVPTSDEAMARYGEQNKKEPKQPVLEARVIAERTKDRRRNFLLHRGDFLQPTVEVQPATLEVLPPLEPRSKTGSPDRLDLARWLVDPANPLPHRVAVNHIWAYLFGQGIVATANDFGVRGEPPTHPDLLEWLARRFIESGFSRKAMIRLIVGSSTYRQSSRHRPELAETDPLNKMLYRQNRFRVEAEIVRDLALAASGLLSRKIGGPSVFPPMPADVAALSYASNFKWDTSKGEDRYRRGMYTFFKRTAPHPNLITFDCPDANTAALSRRTSNTPLQALTTLNNEVFVEAAQGLARLCSTDGDAATDEGRLTRVFRQCVARPPTGAERQPLLELLGKTRRWYAAHPEEAKKLTETHRAEEVPAEENAAWIATARIVLNLDEFITRE